MKVYHAMHEDSPDISKEDKEKMAILKLVDVGKYIKNVGIRDGQFYVLAENDTDEVYLEYKEAMYNINVKLKTPFDERLFNQKAMEFHNKKAKVVQQLMEMPK
jgi:hypothetical protein